MMSVKTWSDVDYRFGYFYHEKLPYLRINGRVSEKN